MNPILFALELWLFYLDESFRKTKQNYLLGLHFWLSSIFEVTTSNPHGFEWQWFSIGTDFTGSLPSGIFDFSVHQFYMWTRNIISHTSQCSLLTSCILVCEKKNAESHRKFPLPRPSCVHSREKRPDGQWVEISGEPAGMHERAFPPLLP